MIGIIFFIIDILFIAYILYEIKSNDIYLDTKTGLMLCLETGLSILLTICILIKY